jgi:lactoylglutathione lyase
MVRVRDLDSSLKFFVEILGLTESRRTEYPEDNFTLVYLKSEGSDTEIELTHNWDYDKNYTEGKNFGHLAFEVEDIYKVCTSLEESGVLINRPPRDGHMAFVKSPDGISIELLQKGEPLEEMLPWSVMKNTGDW